MSVMLLASFTFLILTDTDGNVILIPNPSLIRLHNPQGHLGHYTMRNKPRSQGNYGSAINGMQLLPSAEVRCCVCGVTESDTTERLN